MQQRHANPSLYFQELATTTEKHLIPALEKLKAIEKGMKVAEVGCSIGGNLFPFLQRGCHVYGIDIDPHRIQDAQKLLVSNSNPENVTLINCDILDLPETNELIFDVIIIRDVIEHIHDKNKLLSKLKTHLAKDGIIYFAFPPWRMPFGGHQQVCKSFVSKLPWLHLLPSFFYFRFLKLVGEHKLTIDNLKEVKQTGISIRRFRKLIRENKYDIINETSFFINPHYEAKFRLKPRVLFPILNIPIVSDFYITAFSSFVKPN